MPEDVSLLKTRDLWCVILFLACLAFFINRGPYRAIRFSTTGDFSTVDAAARCWLHGANPYERIELKKELAGAGAPSDIQHDQDINPSVYLPAALPWAASVAWMSWQFANAVWCGLSLALFGMSLWQLLKQVPLSSRARWIIASFALLFSPTYVGIYDGNPGVVAISLVVLAICTVVRSSLASALALGIALCFKPQLALCALCVFAVRRSWRPLFYAGLLFAFASLIGITVLSSSDRDWRWWRAEQYNVAISFEPGGQSDPAPASPVAWQMLNAQTLTSYAFQQRATYNAAVWIFAAVLVAVFLSLRKTRNRSTLWYDAAFFAPLTLTLTYHRYYDAQLLLLIIPLLVDFWRSQRLHAWILSVCFLVLVFPIQSVMARRLGAGSTAASFKQVIFLRNQPIAVLILTVALSLTYAVSASPRGSQPQE